MIYGTYASDFTVDRTSMAESKRCPDCGNPLRLYGAGQGRGVNAGAEIIEYIAVVALPIVLWTLGITGWPLVIATLFIVVAAVLWKPYARARRSNEEPTDLYYCEACDGYFEGAGLRRITEAEAKRAV